MKMFSLCEGPQNYTSDACHKMVFTCLSFSRNYEHIGKKLQKEF